MLVLSRKKDQSIYLLRDGEPPIVITMCGSNGRIGIEAPPDVVILREELINRAEVNELELNASEEAVKIPVK